MNSNYTLRFPRTSREAFGHESTRACFEGDKGDRLVSWICAIGVAFVIGLAMGGAF